VADLVREAQALEARGLKELNLVSQDTTWYGRDRVGRRGEGRGGPDDPPALLPDLLRALLRETDIPWLRLFYMYPSGITSDLVELLATESRLLPYLDMPIQHGSDRILKAMRRPERRKSIRERVAQLRSSVPGITLRTTTIVGFPGETDADFEELLGLLEELRFDRVGAFTFSVEEDTLAATMEGQLPEDVKRDRLEALQDVQRGISFDLNLAQIGQRTEAIVDQTVEGDPEFGFVARTVGQAIDVDGVTHLSHDDETSPGDLVEIEIVDALEYDLIGSLRR
jgi:ribosomal protein S12 methylthiotransferase